MTIAYWVFGITMALITFGPIMLPHGGYAPRHDSTRALAAGATTRGNTNPGAINAGSINYLGNPYRVGSYVYVMEREQPSDLDWQGTYLGMQNGLAIVRDLDTLMPVNVERSSVYSAER